jgi:hypothetical protein
MASVVGDFILTTRHILAQGFRSLPVILGGAIAVLGLTQGNFNLLFFFVGLCILTPTATLIVNAIWETAFSPTSVLPSWLKKKIPEARWLVPAANAEQCSLVATGPMSGVPMAANTVPSYWLTMMGFFFFYLFYNAYDLYVKQEVSKARPQAVQARKSQAVMSMIVVVGLAIIFTVVRYGTSCETAISIPVSALLGGGLAYGWFTFMRNCGLGRLDDLFGISNRIMPQQSMEERPPTVCVPSTSS